MRTLLMFAVAALPLFAQNPVVRISNASRAGSTDFQIGDRIEIVIMGAANEPVSVRTTSSVRSDWGPVIGSTDVSGQWSTKGQFEKADFGDWSEVWTVGGKLANPVVHFFVSAPCLPGKPGAMSFLGIIRAQTCETADGLQTFQTPSLNEPLRTPDGRVIPARSRLNFTAEEYRLAFLESMITSFQSGQRMRPLGDGAAAAIAKIIGVNGLTESEMRNVLGIIRASYAEPELIPRVAKEPTATVLLLQKLADAAETEGLKREIAETSQYVQRQ
jgi:hypothetical protein